MSAEDRNRRAAEELLRWLAEVDEEGTEVPADERLAAYREARMAADASAETPETPEITEIETLLAKSPAARERLAALSGERLPEPSSATREAVLAGFASSARSGARVEPGISRSGRRTAGWLAAAAALAAVVFGTWRLADRFAPAAVPEYQATIAGLAGERAEPAAGTFARALPETVVRIEAMPRDGAVAGVELALYRSTERGLERIAEERLRRLPAGRGALAIEARAADLVGTGPGRHVLFLVAAPKGRLPSMVELAPGERPQAGSGRRVIPLEIELLSAP